MKKETVLKRALIRARESCSLVSGEARALKRKIKEQRGKINALVSGTHGFEDVIKKERKILYRDLNRYRHIKVQRKALSEECKTIKQLIRDEEKS